MAFLYFFYYLIHFNILIICHLFKLVIILKFLGNTFFIILINFINKYYFNFIAQRALYLENITEVESEKEILIPSER